MKLFIVACLSLMLIACQGNTQQKVELKTHKDSVSYMIGMDIGRNFKKQELDLDAGTLAQGLKDFMESKPALTEEKSQELMTSFQQERMAKMQEQQRIKGEAAKKEGEKFLEENKKQEGVKVTASGLQYKVIKEGNGKKPTIESTVTVNYRGTLIDGTEFDNTYQRGQPTTYPVNKFVSGWSEGLQLMSIGSKFMFYVPSELAYGEAGMQNVIPPNATLIFEVELLEIK